MTDRVEIKRGTVMDACQFLAAVADVAPGAVPQVEARLDCGEDFYQDRMARLEAAVGPGRQAGGHP